MLGILVVVLVLGMSHAQSTVPGSCPPDVVTMQDFDIKQYAGRWYTQSWNPTILEWNFRCMVHEYQPQLNNKVSLKTSHVIGNETYEMKYSGYVDGPGKLSLDYDLKGVAGTINEWILDTDYKTYSVIYSCYHFDPWNKTHVELFDIFTRQRMVTEANLKPAYDVILKHGLEVKSLRRRDQSNCDN